MSCFDGWDFSEDEGAKTHLVHGVEIPDLRIEPDDWQGYWYPDASEEELVKLRELGYETLADSHRRENNICYELSDEGKAAAILHAKAWLGIA